MLGNTANYNSNSNNNKRVLATQHKTTRHDTKRPVDITMRAREMPMGILFEGGAELHSLCKTGGTNCSRSCSRHRRRRRSRHSSCSCSNSRRYHCCLPRRYNKSLLACNLFPSPARTDRITSAPPLLQLPLLSPSPLSSLQHFNQDKSIQSKASKSSAGLICSAGQANYK